MCNGHTSSTRRLSPTRPSVLFCKACLAFCAGFSVLQVRAQSSSTAAPAQTTAPALTGAVSGRIVGADTQRPVRFADVSLIQVQAGTGSNDDRDDRGRRISGRTDLDGNFLISSVPPGDYYLTATKVGYVSNAATVFERASGNSPDAASLLRSIPQVHVGANGTTQASLQLERGAVIAGKLVWDDGSPAAGVLVNAASATASNSLSRRGPNPLFGFGFAGEGTGNAETDDRGNFRIAGLPAGAYVVRATFAAPPPAGSVARTEFGGFGYTRPVAISLYAPGKVRRDDALTLTLASGEERDDVLFTADLHGLHNVSGVVSSASNTAVHSGSIRLTDMQDKTLTRYASLNADGSFTVPYVPAGTYTLSANASSASPQSFDRGHRSGTSTTTTVTFQPLQQTLTVTDTDLTGLNLSVVPAASASAQ